MRPVFVAAHLQEMPFGFVSGFTHIMYMYVYMYVYIYIYMSIQFIHIYIYICVCVFTRLLHIKLIVFVFPWKDIRNVATWEDWDLIRSNHGPTRAIEKLWLFLRDSW